MCYSYRLHLLERDRYNHFLCTHVEFFIKEIFFYMCLSISYYVTDKKKAIRFISLFFYIFLGYD